MKKIDIYINEKSDLIESYSANEVSSALIQYMISKVMVLKRKEEFNLNLYVTQATKGCTSLIKDGLKMEYNRSERIHNNITLKQLFLLLIGTIILLFSYIFTDIEILREIIIIIGWVPIWEAVELELFNDSSESNKRRCIKKLLATEFNEIESDNDI